MRGTEKSQGNFSMWISDKNDSQDLGDWIVKQPWSNGKIMTVGASADGIGSMQTLFNNPSWLTAQYIAWAPASMYEILFPHGCYKQETAEQWLHGLTMPNPDVVYDNIRDVYENEWHSPFWAQIELTAEQYKNVHGVNAFWGGWYDLFIVGTLQAFAGYNSMSDPSVRYTSKLVVDPLGHCLDADIYFTEDIVKGRSLLAVAQMMETFGVRRVKRDTLVKNVTFYVMSSNDAAGVNAGQYWTSLEKFPDPQFIEYYLHPDKTVSTSRPKQNEGSESTSYIYDPSNPVPTAGGNNLPPGIGGDIACGPLDQSELDKRPDVVTFQTEVLTEELPLTGPLFAKLYVSSDAIDTDFMVKISDVYPTGEARILQDNGLRMRWRHGLNSGVPDYLNKGEVYPITMSLWNTSYVVAPGHALRVSISSSNWPRFSPNPNNGLLLKDPAYPGTNITATNTIYHSERYPSSIVLPVVKKFQIPNVHVVRETLDDYPKLADKEFLGVAMTALERMTKRAGRNV